MGPGKGLGMSKEVGAEKADPKGQSSAISPEWFGSPSHGQREEKADARRATLNDGLCYSQMPEAKQVHEYLLPCKNGKF